MIIQKREKTDCYKLMLGYLQVLLLTEEVQHTEKYEGQPSSGSLISLLERMG